MDDKIEKMIIDAKKKLSDALDQTGYSNYTNEIIEDYATFIKVCIEKGLIKEEKDLELFRIDEINYYDGTQYANWQDHKLNLQKRFFVERTKEERRNVLFHELIHSLMKQLFSFDNLYYTNFLNYIKTLDKDLPPEQYNKTRKKYNDIYKGGYYDKMSNVVCDAMKTFNEITTQYLAEILTAYSYGKKKKDASVFDSKIMIKNDYFKSYFVTYPEYEQLFISFLRTLNGFGNIEDNDRLFYKWFEELKSGHIWDRIIGTYNNEQSKELLLEFLVGYSAVRKAKESSMGIGVDYTGDKNILTKNLIELDTALAKNINYNKEVKYPHENIPKPPSEYPIYLKLGKKK